VPAPDHYHANLQRGSLLLDQDRPRDALPFLQAAIAANPDAAFAYAELARCWNDIPAERRKSIAAINRAIGLAPGVSYFHGRKGWFHVCLAQYRAAKNAADEGLAINPNCLTSLNALANAHTKLAQWKKAEDACLRILAINPNDAPGLNLLAQALRHQGKWKQSREVVARLLAQMPNNAFGHANAGYAALAAGDHLRANEHFRESLRMDPHFDLARRGLLASLRARIWILRLNMRVTAWLQSLLPGTSHQQRYFIRVAIIAGCLGLASVVDRISSHVSSETFIRFLVPFVIVCMIFLVPLFIYVCLSSVTLFLSHFLLLFDPIGRHALRREEKMKAFLPPVLFFVVIAILLAAHAWSVAVGIVLFFGLLAFSIQYPLLRDRWQQRRARESESNPGTFS
jgi:hypothetical protein